ncbi:MAG: 1,4-alpha-glucan branching protein GlgB [Acidimicrobiia bacterium]|nr:1,4-alpha-glucan branching protein GlgB [Acidimicrobiia bacterium]
MTPGLDSVEVPDHNAPVAGLGREFTADDSWAFNGGTHATAYEVLGAHYTPSSTTFRVWAPSATSIEVHGDFNEWQPDKALLLDPDPSGVWRGKTKVKLGDRYKFMVTTQTGAVLEKADPYGFAHEEAPRNASIVSDLAFDWKDGDWMADRGSKIDFDAPVSIYELHLGSWRYEPGGYAAQARQLAEYAVGMGFTHVELLPPTEHPFYGSWGYQTTGYFAPTARYGSPAEFMEFVDILHRAGIGVILDWVPSHFPDDAFGLAVFDGTHLYEHEDPRLGHHPDWESCIFNYGRAEVRSFLISSANFWLDHYHIDALRVDAVASMLYRDYSREEGEWEPNIHGGNENLEAVAFLRQMNTTLYGIHPGIQIIAEESTAWPGVTKPPEAGGLGFGYKWDLGWMHDTLQYFERDPVHRSHHTGELTFHSVYATSENFVLPLSHDEVVHGKGSLLDKMPGDRWQQLANLRLLLGYQWATPGKKLLFMGADLAATSDWNHEKELDWASLQNPDNAGVNAFVSELNRMYRATPALYRQDTDPAGFEWVVTDDSANDVVAFLRRAPETSPVLVVTNMTPVPRTSYRLGVPEPGTWVPLLESDAVTFGGSGITNDPIEAEPIPAHGYDQSIEVTVGPLAASFFAPEAPK